MPSLKEFVAALQAGWFPALASLVGCVIVVMGDWFQLPYLSSSPAWLLTTAVIVGVFSFSILVANLAYAPVAAWKFFSRRRAAKKYREKLIAKIMEAPDGERAILAYLITTDRQAFSAEFNNPKLSPLVSKGILRKQGGAHSVLEWPYIVQEDVWKYLLEEREAFFFEGANEIADPFHWRNSGF